MEKYIHCEADSKLAENIVCEVKARGVFDELRRECMSDVDTKPAYQNLRHRVETTVKQFLEQQKWTPELNKLNLRERLRKHIADKGFLETGVERIVDQVVNPKINTVFLPRIEDISYEYMGVDKPKDRRMKGLKLDTTQLGFLPTLDLEQVSPDSSSKSKSPENEFNAADDLQRQLDESDDKMEDFESPAFEPHCNANDNASVDMDIADSDDTDYEMHNDENGKGAEERINDIFPNDDGKSNLSSISGLTSNGSMNGVEENGLVDQAIKELSKSNDDNTPDESKGHGEIEKPEDVAEIVTESIQCVNVPVEEEQTSQVNTSNESILLTEQYRESVDVNQDSLSRVSSNSRLSIITGGNNTNAELVDHENAINADSASPQNSGDGKMIVENLHDEEAQMQKFNDSSSSNNSVGDIRASDKNATEDNTPKTGTNFDINKDEIIFEGPERKDYGGSPPQAMAAKESQSSAFESVTNSIKFEPSSFTVRPDEVSCADVENVRTTISDVFDTNSSQSRSNNLVIIENDELNPKSMEPPISVSVSPTANESAPVIEKSSSREKSFEKKVELSSSRSKHSSSRSSDKQKERGSSSASKDRGYSKDKYRKTSSSHSSFSRRDKDKSKSTGHESSSRRHESTSSISKDKPSDSHSRKSSVEKESNSSHHKSSKRDRDNPSSSKDKYSSSSRSKSSSNRSHSDKRSNDDKRDEKHRSEIKKSSSKDDDHAVHHKSKPRQRSRSKDSNDGANPGSGNATAPPYVEVKQNDSKSDEQKSGSSENGSAPPVDELSATIVPSNVPDNTEVIIMPFTDDDEPSPSPVRPTAFIACESSKAADDGDFVSPAHPVVIVDKILVGNELNLEQFISEHQENRDNPLISKIEQTLQSQNKIRKPKTANNFAEAKKASKRRKQIDRTEQKKLEQARVMAKKYLRTNVSNSVDDTQGVELEFACGKEKGGPKGPTISSPVKMNENKDSGIEPNSTETLIASSDLCKKTGSAEPQSQQPAENELNEAVETGIVHVPQVEPQSLTPNEISSISSANTDDFLGFDAPDDVEQIKKLSSLDKYIDVGSQHHTQLFLENNQLDTDMKLKGQAHKRRYTEIGTSPSIKKRSRINLTSCSESDFRNRNTINDYSIKNPELFMAKVIISKSDTPDNVKLKSTNPNELDNNGLIAKPIKKTRYSNDELFKPRPTISGGSRSRRRANCDE